MMEARPVRAPTIPDGRRVYAIGDIHGRADLLDALLAKIDEDRAGGGFDGKPMLVFIGDYIDRGLQSRAVIDRALATAEEGFEPIYLKGNHEAALLAFLDRPDTGSAWFALGGAETLFSYGVPAPKPGAPSTELRFASRALRAAMPHTHLRFFARLRLHAQIGDYLFVHAGLRPGEPLEKQTETDLLEIRQPFLKSRKRWPFVVVHGHTPIDSVTKDQRRIAIDTGAYATGKLSAVRLQGTLMEVLTT
jgi:serine/threonine protein phosphatase 1